MSVVTGVILVSGVIEENGSVEDEPKWLEDINVWLRQLADGSPKWQLTQLDDRFGGGKHPQIYVAGSGFNYFPENEFAEFVMTWPWSEPSEVVLIMHPEDGATRVFRPNT